ncbi:MAG TPA: signal peptide peptidase SppA [Cyclobacteriaceae bacterium]|nr:signal peptide peptidase SppA [Cyclobacteriaceae bacterium]
MRFLSNVLAVIVGLLLFFVVGFFMLAAIVAVSGGSKVETVENSMLHLNLENVMLVERDIDDDFDLVAMGSFGNIPTVGLNQLKKAITTAKNDDNIKGIYLQSGSIFSGHAMLSEVREALEEFKESGKFIVSYSEGYSEKGYFLSSVADEIYLNPLGGMEFNGLSSEMVFLKGLFEKLEVEPVIFRVGEFKSAVEPFILEKMSEESRLQTLSYLHDLNNFSLQKVAESRSIPEDRVREINAQMLVREPEDALALKLVDGLWYDDQVKDLLREKLGLEEDDDIKSINITNINKTAKSENRLSRNRIAVIVADGEIVSGNMEGAISSEVFLKEIRDARKDDDVKAIVLRVNSPGGSVLASEVIWREMSEAQKTKPLIVSMSDVAASGGFYISAPADTIVAHPNTITGSIGIFGLWFNAQGLLNNKLGITTDVAKTGEFSDFMSASRELTETEKNIVQNMVEDGYEVFINRVAEGRGMSRESVLEVASGRVWSGVQAKENGLVDVLGGLDDAIDIAATKAGVEEDYRVIYFPEQKTFLETLLSEFSKDVQNLYGQFRMGSAYFVFQQIERAKKYEGIMVRLPYDISIQ